MAIETTVRGPLATAHRLGAEHLRGALDSWLITAARPVTVTAVTEPLVRMRSQFVMSLARLDDLPDGGYPRKMSATHCLALGALAREFKVGWLDDGARPVVDATAGRLLYAEFGVTGDHTARKVSQVVAQGFAHGEMPLQGRHIAMQFVRCTRMVALALESVTLVPTLTHPADSTH